jgi:diaminopimelate epimerase
MPIPFTKAHGSKNDFLITWAEAAPAAGLAEFARAICDRHTGIGADGWILMQIGADPQVDGEIRLFNSDGSMAELSGNGTRCAAAFLIERGAEKKQLRILTGAGPKELQLLERAGRSFVFEMNMGEPRYAAGDIHVRIPAAGRDLDAMVLNVGNPQCVIFGEEVPADWRRVGAEIERDPRFPNRTNVSFVRRVDDHSIEVVFWERGAGETMSSGTGSTGAAVAAAARGLVSSPVRILTPAGPLDLRLESNGVYLAGPAEITGSGEYYTKETD